MPNFVHGCNPSIYHFHFQIHQKGFYISVVSSLNFYNSVIETYVFLSTHIAPLGSGEAKMYDLKMPAFEQFRIWDNNSVEVFNHTHFKACGFNVIIL